MLLVDRETETNPLAESRDPIPGPLASDSVVLTAQPRAGRVETSIYAIFGIEMAIALLYV